MTQQESVTKLNVENSIGKGTKGRVYIFFFAGIAVLMLIGSIMMFTGGDKKQADNEARSADTPEGAQIKKSSEVSSAQEASAKSRAQQEAAKAAKEKGEAYIGAPITVVDASNTQSTGVPPGQGSTVASLESKDAKKASESINAQTAEEQRYAQMLKERDAQRQASRDEKNAANNPDQEQQPTSTSGNTAGTKQPVQMYEVVDSNGQSTLMTAQEYRQYQQNMTRISTEIRTEVNKQVERIFQQTSGDAYKGGYTRVEFPAYKPPEVKPNTQGSVRTTQSPSGNNQQGKPIIVAGTSMYGTFDLGVDTDTGALDVAVTIRGGPYSGAKAFGRINRGNDNISAKLTRMQYKGEIYSIDALVLSASDLSTALADDIDRHYFRRYGSLFAASLLTGIGKAATINAQSGDIIYNDIGGQEQVITRRDPLKAKEVAGIAIGEVGVAVGGEIARRNVNVPDTFKAYRNKDVGIYFLNNVYRKGNQQ